MRQGVNLRQPLKKTSFIGASGELTVGRFDLVDHVDLWIEHTGFQLRRATQPGVASKV